MSLWEKKLSLPPHHILSERGRGALREQGRVAASALLSARCVAALRAQALRRPQLLHLGICTSNSVISEYRLGAQGGVQQILPQLPKVHREPTLQLLFSAVQTASVRG